jgi:hypothetical protein
MATKYIYQIAENRPIGHLTASKIYPNWYFWFENMPSGNPGANLTTLSYNASVVKNHDLTNSIARFYSEIFFL